MKLEKVLINLIAMMTAMQGMALLVNGQWIDNGWESIAIMVGLTALFTIMQHICEQICKL